MIDCKKYIIATCFTLMFPLVGWSEAPVVDDSDNFAVMGEQQAARAPVVDSRYEEPQMEVAQIDRPRMEEYPSDRQQDEGPAFAKEESNPGVNTRSNNKFNDNANLIEKVQSLQQEVQELRGQLEVQAHDLKLLQQQQVAFYKDLDARLGAVPAKVAQSKPATKIAMPAKVAAPAVKAPVKPVTKVAQTTTAPKIAPVPVVAPVSRANPADEQISYLAAYELVTSKRYDEAVNAMQNFVQKYPTGGYTANAEYWVGELYLVKKDYSKAIEHFEVVLDKFPTSSKSAASMLKTGYAFAATGNDQEAKKRYQQVLRTYPDTPTAQLAKTKLEAIDSV